MLGLEDETNLPFLLGETVTAFRFELFIFPGGTNSEPPGRAMASTSSGLWHNGKLVIAASQILRES